MFDSIQSAQNDLEQGRVTAVELCEATIARIHRFDGNVNAFSHVLLETARAEAVASDARREQGQGLGPIDGIPIAVKNLIDTVPAESDCGLGPSMLRTPTKDAAVVARLRSAGAVIVGLTHTDASGFGTTTPQTINPIAPDLIAGGSSGGSAAAVACGMAFGALGTDTGGSIRIPAECCGIAGFKPSWGRISADGVHPLAPSFDHVGCLARSVRDLATLQQIIDPAAIGHSPIIEHPPQRLGLARSWSVGAADHGGIAIDHVEMLARANRVDCRSVMLPHHDDFLVPHVENALREAFDYYADIENIWTQFPDTARESLELGRTVSDQTRGQNHVQRALVTDRVERLFDDVDAIVLPVLPMDVPQKGAVSVVLEGCDVPILQATIRFTALFNFTGHPVVALPAFALPDGRAVHIQLVGSKNSDFELLAVALWLENLLELAVDHAALVDNMAAPKFQEQAT